ncbi:hypothetical protein NQ317_019546 [Molorchus minor]|uniref:Fibronectin type-III domain-containing protein n=1 Tax=Molorchus minor TaxID=1323400 RepID=A0ABQ9J6M5_9CUCU|nr:hypothetical protein NQ317_019546 [Molorchus minor]
MSCFWDLSTTPQYRQAHAVFDFHLRMNNTFGTNDNYFRFEHFQRILPNAPENLTAIATSPHSVHLKWVLPYHMGNFHQGLQHRILYQCEYYEKVWQFGGMVTDPNKTVKKHEFELTELKYAHALCDIRVSSRIKAANPNDESLWSENATTTVRTLSDIPDGPPKTNNMRRMVRILRIMLQSKIIRTLKPEITKSYARFQNLSYIDYVINIRSVNKIGFSRDKSTVVVPASPFGEPSNFLKIEGYRKNLYELSWEPAVESIPYITNYTIFWCNNERDRPHQCMGNLNWTTVPRDVVKHNLTLPGNAIYQFAISANSHNSSSGMSWADCTIVSSNEGVGKIKLIWINRVGSDFMDVSWKLDCSTVGVITGFVIYYCPVESPPKNDCKGPEKNVTIRGDVNLQSGTITGLKPYTTYRLYAAFIVNNSTSSHFSEPLFNTTNEAAPATSPQNIHVVEVTNNSVTLKWQRPHITNGHLKNYIVSYNDKERIVEPEKNSLTLKNLSSYTNYTIKVKACTVACSKESDPIIVTTKMWIPGVVNRPEIFFPNKTHITFIWKKPELMRGKIDYYQIMYSESKTDNKTNMHYVNVTSNNFTIENCKPGKYKGMFVAVRAVNIIGSDHDPGPWSDFSEAYCHTPYTPFVYILVGVLIVFILILVMFAFKRAYVSIKDMKNIDPKLPPGLSVKVNINNADNMRSMNSIGADEELLLNKIKGGLRSSGDSSGCSSGHESITSSLESTTHISPSDSGTEQPKSPSLSENRRHSLRQRNVAPGVRPTSKGYVLPEGISVANWPTKPTPTSAGNYCVLGIDPLTKSESDTSYVPVTDMTSTIPLPFTCDLTQPPPYVVTGDFIKASNLGYVPNNIVPEPTGKSTGYVVAGLTKDLVATDLLQCERSESSAPEKSLYIKAAESLPGLKGVQFPWQQAAVVDNTVPKLGYVSVGDAPPPLKTIPDVTKGYVPHRQFDVKSIKED